MIECFNILLLTDEAAFRTFTEGDLESRFTSISYQAIGHPAIVPCVLFASTFGLLYNELVSSLETEDPSTIRSRINQRMVIDEVRRATNDGQLALIEQLATLRLKIIMVSLLHCQCIVVTILELVNL